MDNDTSSPPRRATPRRTLVVRVSAVLAALLALAALPALAAAHVRRRGFVRRQEAIVQVRQTNATPHHGAHGSTTTHRARGHRRRHALRCPGARAPIGSVRHGELDRAVVCLLNAQRRRRGLPGLRANGRLNSSAQSWTNTMVRERAFSHGTDFAARISAAGFHWSRVGENIATGFQTAASVVRAWMGSTGHCQNILDPAFREVGTGIDAGSAMGADARGTWTQDFGLLMGQRASGNWAPAEGCPY